ncbi:MAG TPA: hypothetical protein VF881_21395 [Polyangiaceae bacterium]
MQTAYTWQDDPLLAPHELRDEPTTQWPWLKSATFDVLMLVASVVIVPAVLIAVWLGASSASINLGVTAIVGGPHVFGTFTATFADRSFRKRHPWLIASSLLIPAGVVWLSIHHFQALMSAFIMAASLHVLHQCAYLTDCYRTKAGFRERPWARLVDYGLLFTSIYPIALYKIVHGTFYLGDVAIIIPSVFMHMQTVYLEWIAFSAFLGLWIYKTMLEQREGTLNGPKTLLVGVTVFFAFLVPGTAGQTRLELAFQSMNAWHSFQYLGLVWLINTMRHERGQLTNKFVARLSGPKGAKWFYAWNVAVTLVLLVVVKGVVTWDPLRLAADQYYYMLILSPLLIHYYFDTFVFLTSVADLVPSFAKARTALETA